MERPENTADNAPGQPPGSRFLSWTYVAWGAALGFVAAAVGCFALMFVLLRDDIPRLTADALRQAEAAWDQHAPASYFVNLRLGGAQAGNIQVEVREGEVRRPPTLNGRPVQERHTWRTWTVEGQFETLHRELELAEDPAQQMHLGPDVQLRLRAEFDPTFGYPRRYERLVIGNGPEVRWEVLEFQPL